MKIIENIDHMEATVEGSTVIISHTPMTLGPSPCITQTIRMSIGQWEKLKKSTDEMIEVLKNHKG